MSNRTTHTMTATIPVGPSDLGAEIELAITFTFLPGVPATGPTYDSGGQPADPDEVEVVSAIQVVNGKEVQEDTAHEQAHIRDIATNWLDNIGYDDAVAHAVDELADDRERAEEARAEAAREDR